MARILKRWTGKIVSHGIHLLTDTPAPAYGIKFDIELDREEGRHVDVLYRDAEDAEWLGHRLVHTALTARMHNLRYAFGQFKNDGGVPDVHTGHCCDRHGCRYGKDATGECTVTSGAKPQERICEQCDHELEEADAAARAVLDIRNARDRARRARG